MDDEIDVKLEALSIALRGWLNSEESEMKVQQIEEITQKIKELQALK
jgi:hypothetical protein